MGRGIGLDTLCIQLHTIGGQIHLQFHELNHAKEIAHFSFMLQLPSGCFYELSEPPPS